MKDLIEKTDKKQQIIKFIAQIIIVGIAGAIGGVAFKTFFEAIGIVPTGLSGFALIIKNLFSSGGIELPTAVIYLILNVFIFLFALKIFGWKFLVLSGVGAGCYTLGMEFGFISALVPDPAGEKLLYAIVGAIIVGLTIGVALRFGGSTGGSEILGAIINRYIPKIKTGYCILMFNVVVLLLSIITSGLQTGLYALVVAIISSMATNLVLEGSKRVLAYYIICDEDEEISKAILDKYHRGVTRLDAVGMFSKQNKSILLCLIPNEQAHEMKKLVAQIDQNAFVFSAPVNETIGEGNFMKKASPLKYKLKNFSAIIKSNQVYKRHEKIKQLKLKRKQKRFKEVKINRNLLIYKNANKKFSK